ncbi:MAG: hypothetical protein ACLFV1_04740 [Thiohalophilus sp.]
MDELQTVITDALIDTCYGYETSDYIDILAKDSDAAFTDHDKKLLDILLSCIGIATAQYVIRKRYGSKSDHFCAEAMIRLRSRLQDAGLPDDALAAQFELIENSFEVIKRELPSVNEYTAGNLSMSLMEPFSEDFANVDLQSSRLHLWLFTFVVDVAQLSATILDNAEKKYNFSL